MFAAGAPVGDVDAAERIVIELVGDVLDAEVKAQVLIFIGRRADSRRHRPASVGSRRTRFDLGLGRRRLDFQRAGQASADSGNRVFQRDFPVQRHHVVEALAVVVRHPRL